MKREIEAIAHIQSDFPEKFGIPRQSGMALTQAKIIFEPKYRLKNAFKGLEGYSHIWLLWEFSKSIRSEWSPMVHPPRLGGNTLMGVFGTRSPYRPNHIGLSSVKLDKIEFTEHLGPIIYISGADLMNGTPIYDIKPYLAYTDSHPDAIGGFADDFVDYRLKVVFPDELLNTIPQEKQQPLIEVLSQDPRPSYQNDPHRIYGIAFSDKNIRFRVNNDTLTVCDIEDYTEYVKSKNNHT